MNDHPAMVKIGEFHKRHGPESYNDGSVIVYADGAYRDINPLGILADPPTPDTVEGEYLLAHRKLQFTQLKLKAAVREFDELNTRLAHCIPADEEAELAKLKRLKDHVDACKELVTAAEDAVANTRHGKHQADMRRQQEEEQVKWKEFQSRRREIRV